MSKITDYYSECQTSGKLKSNPFVINQDVYSLSAGAAAAASNENNHSCNIREDYETNTLMNDNFYEVDSNKIIRDTDIEKLKYKHYTLFQVICTICSYDLYNSSEYISKNIYLPDEDYDFIENFNEKLKIDSATKEEQVETLVNYFAIMPDENNNNNSDKSILRNGRSISQDDNKENINLLLKHLDWLAKNNNERVFEQKNYKYIDKQILIIRNIPYLIIVNKIINGGCGYQITKSNIQNIKNIFSKINHTYNKVNPLETLFEYCFKEPYINVTLTKSIFTYKQAKNIESYFDLKLKIDSKIKIYIEYLLYNKNKIEGYNIHEIYKDIFKKKEGGYRDIYIKSHVITFIDLFRFIKLEFNLSSKVILNYLKNNIGYYIGYKFEFDIKYLDDVLKIILSFSSTYIEKILLYGDDAYGPNNCKIKNDKTLKILSQYIITKEIYDIERNISDKFKEWSLITFKENKMGKNYLKCKGRQQDIFKNNKQLILLNGGPGTGKTFTVSSYLCDNKSLYGRVICLAPTACASKNLYDNICKMNTTTGNVTYYTIDKFINLNIKNIKNIINQVCFIIDEFSMCSYKHIYGFIDIIKCVEHFKLIIVGDFNQLSSIGIGNLAKDVFSNSLFTDNIITLKYNVRSENAPGIIDNVNNVLLEKPIIMNDETEIIEYSSNNEKDNYIKNLLSQENIDKNNTKIISPTNTEIRNCNKLAQQTFNPDGKILVKNYDNTMYKECDVIVAQKNFYEEKSLKYSTGSLWILMDNCNNEFTLISMDDKKEEIKVDYTIFITDFQLGYCVTTHKSQGLTIDNVIFVLPNNNGCKFMMTDPNMNGKQNLYTAISRAKKKIYILKQKGFNTDAIYNSKYVKKTNLF